MSNPKLRADHVVSVDPNTDALQIKDSRGNVIGWIDSSGSGQGSLQSSAVDNSLQGNPISPAPPAPNQVLSWTGSAWAPTNLPPPPVVPTTSSSLQGNPISPQVPGVNQVLTWNGSSWIPSTPSAGGSNFVLASKYMWTQSPIDDLSSPGNHNITLSPCPAGFYINTGGTGYTPTFYVYVAGTGTPEADKTTLVSGHAGEASCVVSVTTRNAHSVGYTVSSASGGIKEASEAARSNMETNSSFHNYFGGLVFVDTAGSPYKIYAPLHFEANFQTIKDAGGAIDCYVAAANGAPADDDCIVVGQRANQNTTIGVTLDNLVMNPRSGNATNYTFDAVHVNAQGTYVLNTPRVFPSQGGQGSWNSFISVCDDEAFRVQGLELASSVGLRSDQRGQAIYALAEGDTRNSNSCFAVGWLQNINGNMQCGGNAVTWLSGNGLRISDSVVQGFSQYGIRTGAPTGGFNGNTQLDNVYYEASVVCANPDYVAAGAIGAARSASAGIITQGGTITAHGSTGVTGLAPTFSCSGSAGSNSFNYWIIPNNVGGLGFGPALFAGYTASNCSGTVTGFFPDIPVASGTMQYDIVRTVGRGANLVAPYFGGNPGGSVATTGSVIVGQISTGNTIQTFMDDASANTTSYSMTQQAFVPYLPQWPGNVILSPAANASRASIPVSMLIGDINIAGGNGIGLVSSNGMYGPSYYSLSGGTYNAGPAMLGTMPVTLGAYNQATLLPRGLAAAGPVAGSKGRLNFLGTDLTGFPAGASIITLVDSQPGKSLSVVGNMPAMDATDVFIAADNTGNVNRLNVPLAFGSPATISNYINSLPDGSSWKERLTAADKQFAVPVKLASFTFATLPANPQNGWAVYCGDCTIGSSCTGNGSGAFARRIAGTWNCS